MKNLLLTTAITILGLTSLFAQSTLSHLNFKTEVGSKKITWEMIVESDKLKDDLKESYMDNVAIINNELSGKIENSVIVGWNYGINFNYKISFKDNKYRVLIYNIVFLTSNMTIMNYTQGDMGAEVFLLNKKGTKIKTNKTVIFKGLQEHFEYNFTLNDENSDGKDW